MFKTALVLICTLLFIVPTMAQSSLDALKADMAKFNLDDPASDVQRNLEQGDKRCIAICGYSCECPGEDPPGLLTQRRVDGTSDMPFIPSGGAEAYGALREKVTKYAKQYNKSLAEKLHLIK